MNTRFVILEHDFPTDHKRRKHWDLMVERRNKIGTTSTETSPGEANCDKTANLGNRQLQPPHETSSKPSECSSALRLLTWALERPPQMGCPIPAVRLPNHRLAYLHYEGPVSNNRGSVRRILRGLAFWPSGGDSRAFPNLLRLQIDQRDTQAILLPKVQLTFLEEGWACGSGELSDSDASRPETAHAPEDPRRVIVRFDRIVQTT